MAIYDRVCKLCNISFKGGPRAYYCTSCRLIKKREADKRFRTKGRKAERPIGSIDKCKICGNEYSVNSARQVYCTGCAPVQYKIVDRIQGLDYYNINKDDINIKRMQARRTIRKCPICNKDYWAVGGKIACTSECKNILLKQRKKSPSQ